jgi:hypothetical protein
MVEPLDFFFCRRRFLDMQHSLNSLPEFILSQPGNVTDESLASAEADRELLLEVEENLPASFTNPGEAFAAEGLEAWRHPDLIPEGGC